MRAAAAAGRFSSTESGLWASAASTGTHNTHVASAGKPCMCPFCAWNIGGSKLISASRRPRTVSSGMQTMTQMNFDDWWEVDPQLEARAMVFRTYRQTKPFFRSWFGVVVQVGRSRAIMKKFFQQLKSDSVALSFSRWTEFVVNQKSERETEGMVYNRFKFFNQLQCLKLWRIEAAKQASTRKIVKTIGFRIMNASLNVCFLTWAFNVHLVARQREILQRFVLLMTHAALLDCFAAWSDLTTSNVEQRKQESIMRIPPYWKPPRSQHMYKVTVMLMSPQTVCVTARLYGALTSSDDVQGGPSHGQAQIDFSIACFTHLGKRRRVHPALLHPDRSGRRLA
jgi:hypothetical protein